MLRSQGLHKRNAFEQACDRDALFIVLQDTDGQASNGHSHCCVPMVHSGNYLGLFSIYLHKGHSPDEKEKEFLLTIANTLTGVITYKRTEERLLYHAFHDTLTGLPNRTMFVDRLNEEVARLKDNPSLSFATLILDLDRFNMVNESLGHQLGDKILTSIGQRIKSLLGDNQVAARLGGDEFAVLMKDLPDFDQVVILADRILESLSRPLTADGHDLYINGSIGIAFSNEGYSRGEDMLRDADTALHRAKLRGRARYEVFDQEMHVKAKRLMEMVSDLRQALTRNEFVLHYQPIIDLRSG